MSGEIKIFKGSSLTLKNIMFNFGELYFHAHQWLEERNYEVIESKYDERILTGGKNYLMIWNATKEIDTYTKFHIKVTFTPAKIKNVEVQQGGDKLKLQKGEFNLKVDAKIITDHEDKWEEKPFFKFMKGFYEKYLYKDSIERLKTELWEEGWAFVNEIKAYLNLYKYM